MIQLTTDFRGYLQAGSLLLVLVASVAFSLGRQQFKTSKGVQVHIDNTYDNYFVEQSEIKELMNGGGRDYVTGSFLADIDLGQLEMNIEKHPYVADAQVYRDLKGTVSVYVKQRRPIARIIKDGRDSYITTTGIFAPESEKFTARVPLIEMRNIKLLGDGNIAQTTYGSELLKFLNIIRNDKFWNAQLAGMMIDATGEITIQPQVTKQIIEFGYPDQVDQKLKKLKVFYKKILPVRGWNSYDRVSVKYDNQIICE